MDLNVYKNFLWFDFSLWLKETLLKGVIFNLETESAIIL